MVYTVLRTVAIAIFNKIKFDLIFLLCFGLLLFLLNSTHIILYLKLPILAGYDGQSHMAVAQYYANNIFPRTWGWIPEWYGGMPFPEFYPPLFYFLMAVFSKILPFSFISIFKAFTLILFLSIPGLLALVARRLISTSGGWIAGLISVLIISDYGIRSHWGTSLYSLFHNGLETQLLGFVCLIPWLYFMLTLDKSPKTPYFAGFFLFLVFLSNAHIVQVAAVLFFSVALSGINKKNYQKYFLVGFIPLLAAAFWYVPMLVNHNYLVSVAIVPSQLETYTFFIFPGIFLLLTIFFANRLKNNKMLVIPCTFIILLPTLFLSEVFSSFPFYSVRLISIAYSLVPIPLAYLIIVVTSWIPSRAFKIFATVLLLAPIFGIFWIGSNSKNFDAYYLDMKADAIPEIISLLRDRPGSVHVEKYSSIGYKSYTLSALLGMEGISTNYINFRESAVSSLFRIPLLNSLSYASEVWGIKSFLKDDIVFFRQSLFDDLDRARFMNVNYFLAQSYQVVGKMKTSKELNFEKDLGRWKLFSLKDHGVEAQVPQVPVMALFSDVSFKSRDINSYDYVRIQEELLFWRGYHTTLFAEANDLYLDTTSDLERFPGAMIAKYKYHDLDKAFNRLREYSLKHHLVLVENTDPLFVKLSTLNDKNIYVVSNNPKTDKRYNPVREEMKKLFDSIQSWDTVDHSISPAVLYSYNAKSECISLTMGGAGEESKPVLVKSSYFPSWQASNGQSVYLASPSFILTFMKPGIQKICFDDSKNFNYGMIISVITIVGVLFKLEKQRRIK